ncbi:MAG: penicillin-binding protein activator [Alphaproteobacteria bacterium]
MMSLRTPFLRLGQRRPRLGASLCAVLALGLALLVAGCPPPKVATAPSPDQESAAPETLPSEPPELSSEAVEEQSLAALPPESAIPGVIVGRPEAVRVGLLVPLSGPHKAEGQALLDAAQLALFDAADNRFTLLPADTGGTPAGASEAAAKLIGGGARLLLGPLFSQEAQAVAPLAQARGVSVVSFSNNPEAASDGVFLLGHTANQEIERLVSHAQANGRQRFAVLAPANSYGQLVSRLVRETTVARGASLGPVQFYSPNAGSEELEQVVRGLAQAGGFDALVVPEGGLRLLQLLPQLAVHELTAPKVQLLGPGLWADPRVQSEPALRGAWYVSPQPDGVADFHERFKAVYGYEPHRIAPLGYDAAALAILLSQGSSGADFSTTALLDRRGFFGTEGIFRFGAGGTAERGLAVIEIGAGGALKVASPAPGRFPSPATAGTGTQPAGEAGAAEPRSDD